MADGAIRFPVARNPSVRVIVVVHNQAGSLRACMESLCASMTHDTDVCFVDNASTDQTPGILGAVQGAGMFRAACYLPFPELIGLQDTTADYLLFLDPDVALCEGSLQAGLALLKSDPGVGVVCGRVLASDGTVEEAGADVRLDGTVLPRGAGTGPDAPILAARATVACCSTAFMMTPRRLFEEWMIFDLENKPGAGRFVDYCLTLRGRGRDVVYEPGVTVKRLAGRPHALPLPVDWQDADRSLLVARHRDTLARLQR